MDDDLIELLDDEDEAATGAEGVAAEPWRLLIVDDDEEVHKATRFALDDVTVEGRPLELYSVHSAAEAMEFLAGHPRVSVILLDVVMESEDAGLRLVERIREELKLQEPRIILRTGQPGYAPEVEVISRYDINDYRTKSELTHARLLTSIIAALRGYEQIRRLNRSRAGLERIISATNELSGYEELLDFARHVLRQVAKLLDLTTPDAALILLPHADEAGVPAAAQVVAASGEMSAYAERPLAALPTDSLSPTLHRALEHRDNVITGSEIALLCDGKRYGLCLWVAVGRPVDPEEHHLLRVFAQHLSVSADKFALIDHLQQIAYQDPLTGLPNRQALMKVLHGELESPAGRVLVLLDIDHFNSINENIGYDGAEQLLERFSVDLQQRVSADCATIARIGPDIFALIGAASYLDLARAEQLTLTDLELDAVGTVKLTLTGSLVPMDAGAFTPERLLSAAYAMLKEAKRDSTGHVVPYRAGLIDEVHENAILLQEMSHALPAGEFRMAYQPKWDLKKESFHGMEALIRWQKQNGEWVSPAKFIPVAESSGIIVKIGQWVVRTACAEYAELLKVNPDPGPVAINVSGGQFRDEQFIPLLQECMEQHGIRPDQLTMEITETAAINDGLEDAVARLKAIREMGVHVALDDFGTGYSSLSYLQQLPVDQLKIDRAFVQRMHEPEGKAIMGTMIALSHALHLDVVAEGAEEIDEVVNLAGLDCDVLQGYVYSRPMSMEDLIAWQASPAARLQVSGD